jgi:FkbM family methyltransferase
MAMRMVDRFGEFMRFVKYLPQTYRAHVGFCQQRFRGLEMDPSVLFIDRQSYVRVPNDVSTFRTWQSFVTSKDGVEEIASFRRLASSCRSMLDIGGAQGLFSAVFAAVTTGPARIVAVEPTDLYCRLHRETAANNGRTGLEWQLHQLALSNQVAETTLGGDVLDGHFDQFAASFELDQPLEVTTLDLLCERLKFVPELIKIDIDSFEHEVFLGSPTFLARHRPKLHLELHPADLHRRGKDPAEVMELVLKSHRVVSAMPKNYLHAPVARLTLLPR